MCFFYVYMHTLVIGYWIPTFSWPSRIRENNGSFLCPLVPLLLLSCSHPLHRPFPTHKPFFFFHCFFLLFFPCRSLWVPCCVSLPPYVSMLFSRIPWGLMEFFLGNVWVKEDLERGGLKRQGCFWERRCLVGFDYSYLFLFFLSFFFLFPFLSSCFSFGS